MSSAIAMVTMKMTNQFHDNCSGTFTIRCSENSYRVLIS